MKQDAVHLVVEAPGVLDGATALEAHAVTRLDVAEEHGEVRGLFRATLHDCGAPDLLNELELTGFVGQLGHKSGRPQPVVDAAVGHGLVEVWQA